MDGGRKRVELWLVIVGSIVLATLCRVAFKSDWIELAGFVTGCVAVYLSVKENVWFFSIGIVNSLLYVWFFFQGRMFADMNLQVYFAAMLALGWWSWLHGGPGRTELHIGRLSRSGWVWVVAGTAAMTAVLVPVLVQARGSSVFWDASLTSVSFAAQMLQNRKRLENWLLWIVANLGYVPLFLSRGYYPTAILYLIFLLLAVAGWTEWQRKLAGAGGAPTERD